MLQTTIAKVNKSYAALSVVVQSNIFWGYKNIHPVLQYMYGTRHKYSNKFNYMMILQYGDKF